MKNTTWSGVLLLAGALGGLIVMIGHPSGHDLAHAADPAAAAAWNRALHALALATLPLTFLGLLGLTRWLGWSDLSVTALVLYGFGTVATMPAAVMSGFVAGDLIVGMRGAEESARAVGHELLRFGWLINQASYALAVVAISLAILAWSWAVLRLRRGGLDRAVGALGLVVGLATPVAVVSGHLDLDLHGLVVVLLSQSAWFVGVAVLLIREGRRQGEGQPSR